MLRLLLLLVSLLTVLRAGAEQELLRPEQAFGLRATVLDAGSVELQFDIADGYYLYRDKFRFEAGGAPAGTPEIPPGETKHDEIFGDVQVYRGALRIRLPLGAPPADGKLALEVTSQGCADAGVCYPPLTRTLNLDLGQPGQSASAPGAGLGALAGLGARLSALGGADEAARPLSDPPAPPASASVGGAGDESSRVARLLRGGNLALVLATFFGFGLLLSLTPCMFPMIPILSGIIVGHGHAISRAQAFGLSLAYVLGMALTYALAGVAAGLSGTLLSAALQNAWVLGGFALVFVLLSLSMFGFYELQLPPGLQARLSGAANRRGGSLAGVALMGALSALIVGPCVAAPLAGALLYIAQTRDAALGGAALFFMALGMGAPLLAVGLASRSLLPKAGAWMEAVKRFFGVMLLAVAIWMVSPVLPAVATMLAWSALLIVSAIYLRALDPLPAHAGGWHTLWKGVGVMALLAGAALLVGAAAGSRDPLQPLGVLRAGAATEPRGPAFRRVASLAELDAAIAASERPVMLDFYADWCVSCKEMERLTFADPVVMAELARFTLLQADVTANAAADKALLARFGLWGPPGILFFAPRGEELAAHRVIGFESADGFAARLQRVSVPRRE